MKKSSKAVISIAAAAGIALGVAPTASAEAVTGWTAPTPPANGVIYLHNSTINNSPTIKASSKVYTVNGAVVAPANMAVRAREFKSGALCEVVDYQFNDDWAASLEIATPGVGCGSGSYNSHGFVMVWNGTAFSQYVTFPSNPVNYTAPGARQQRQAEPAPEETRTNQNGDTVGSAEGLTDPELPDLVSAIGTDGTAGYVRATDIAYTPASPEQALADAASRGPRSVPLFAEDGITEIGSFPIS